MATYTAQDIQKIYLAYFGRPADPAGLAWWLQQVNADGDLSKIAAGFSSSEESKALYDSYSNADLVKAIYHNVLGRDPDPEGLKWYTEQLDKKLISPGLLAIRVADGVKNEDATTLNQRIAAAQDFTAALDKNGKEGDYVGSTAAAAAREWIYGIGPDKSDLSAAQAALNTLISSLSKGTVQGTAVDSYLSGASVFIDANGNGKLDAGEISTKTDANGHFVLPANAPNGEIIVEGGTNLATGQANTTQLKAPVGTVTVTPLTTLVQTMIDTGIAPTAEKAHNILFAALKLPQQVAPSLFDPIQATLNGDATTKAVAVTLEAKTV